MPVVPDDPVLVGQIQKNLYLNSLIRHNILITWFINKNILKWIKESVPFMMITGKV